MSQNKGYWFVLVMPFLSAGGLFILGGLIARELWLSFMGFLTLMPGIYFSDSPRTMVYEAPSFFIVVYSLLFSNWGLFILSMIPLIFGQKHRSDNGKKEEKEQKKNIEATNKRWREENLEKVPEHMKRVSKSFSENTSSDSSFDQIKSLKPQEFEDYVAELWSKKGWDTKVTKSSQDKGIDIIAEKNDIYSKKTLIQVKRYSEDNKVTSKQIQQYSSLKYQEENVDEVIIVTTSSFTSNARQLAKKLNVKLIDGEKLANIVRKTDDEDEE